MEIIMSDSEHFEKCHSGIFLSQTTVLMLENIPRDIK